MGGCKPNAKGGSVDRVKKPPLEVTHTDYSRWALNASGGSVDRVRVRSAKINHPIKTDLDI